MAKICASEYAYDLIKNCQYMYLLKSGEPRCNCTKSCAMCSAGGKVVTTLKIKAEKNARWGKQTGTGQKSRKVKRYVPIIPREIKSQQVPIWMHPDLHEGYIKTQARNIRSNSPKSPKTPKMSGGPSAAAKAKMNKQKAVDEAKMLIEEGD